MLPKPPNAEQPTEDEVYPHGVALCVGNEICVSVNVVQGRSHSLSDHRAFYLALIAFVCVLMGVLSGNSPARLADTDWLTRHIDDRVEQIKAPDHTALPMVSLDTRFAEDFLDEVVELAETTDDDETRHCPLLLDTVPRFGGNQTGLYESSADRALALTPFRLRAFSTRGSPSA